MANVSGTVLLYGQFSFTVCRHRLDPKEETVVCSLCAASLVQKRKHMGNVSGTASAVWPI